MHKGWLRHLKEGRHLIFGLVGLHVLRGPPEFDIRHKSQEHQNIRQHSAIDNGQFREHGLVSN